MYLQPSKNFQFDQGSMIISFQGIGLIYRQKEIIFFWISQFMTYDYNYKSSMHCY